MFGLAALSSENVLGFCGIVVNLEGGSLAALIESPASKISRTDINKHRTEKI